MVLAIRQSGASFTGNYNIRSPIFERLLRERDARNREIDGLRDELVPKLHALIPSLAGSEERAGLLRLKRNIWNRRAPLAHHTAILDDDLQRQVALFGNLVKAADVPISALQTDVVAELRSALRALIQDERFRCAVDYSCPWLIESYERHPPSALLGFTKEERGLYAYAVKFFSKANPLHVFAGIGFLRSNGTATQHYCELMLDAAFLLRLETLLLSSPVDPYRRYIYLRSFVDDGPHWRFLGAAKTGLSLITIRKSPVLERLAHFLSQTDGPRSRGESEDAISAELPHIPRREITAYLNGLVRHGVLVEYLIRDFVHFAECLSGLNSDIDKLLDVLRPVHLTPLPEQCLPEVQRRIENVQVSNRHLALQYYVNTYFEPAPAVPDAGPLQCCLEGLRALRPFFATLPNTQKRNHVIRRFLVDQAAAAPGGSVPYLQVLCEFLRRPREIINRYSAEVSESEVEPWLRSLGQLEGIVGLDGLPSRPPLHAFYEDEGLCFNGPLDYSTGAFYPTNIFAGGGRYIARYVLHEGAKRYQANTPKSHTDAIDVQLAVPFCDNRSWVSALHATGCGFDARYRYQFEHWIDPSAIAVHAEGEHVVYRHIPTGQHLRIRHVGFILADQLPPEYALLLANHADYYRNPFALNPREETIGNRWGAIVRVPALWCGSICLRREEWRIAATVLGRTLNGNGVVAATVLLRDFLRDLTGRTTNDWYFRAPRVKKGGLKPRYLDLTNPLSVQVLSRDLVALGPEDVVSCSPMEPPVEHLFSAGTGRFTTEVMLEV